MYPTSFFSGLGLKEWIEFASGDSEIVLRKVTAPPPKVNKTARSPGLKEVVCPGHSFSHPVRWVTPGVLTVVAKMRLAPRLLRKFQQQLAVLDQIQSRNEPSRNESRFVMGPIPMLQCAPILKRGKVKPGRVDSFVAPSRYPRRLARYCPSHVNTNACSQRRLGALKTTAVIASACRPDRAYAG